MEYKWVLKENLLAQGFYEGETHVWLPKNSQLSKGNPSPRASVKSTTTKLTWQKWQPKPMATQKMQDMCKERKMK